MEKPSYHVMLEGRRLGPYDRRTIVGMRIKQTLTSDHVLEADDGTQLTVADLLRAPQRDNGFQPNRSGSYSLVQATYPASLLGVRGGGIAIPLFRGELEARVQTDSLRLAGRYRDRMKWKDGRVKLPLRDVVHARVRNSVVDLWLRGAPPDKLQRVSLELFTHVAAGELVEWLPNATPWPETDSQPDALREKAGAGHRTIWLAAAAGTAVVAVIVLLTLLLARRY